MQDLDFAEIKRTHSILDVAKMLNMKLDKEPTTYRSECPHHPSKDPRKRKLVITPQKGEHGAWYCAISEEGGYDCISLAAHMLQCRQVEAAKAIVAHFGETLPTLPQSEARGKEPSKKFDPLAYAEKVDSDHPAVDEIGFAPDFAKKHKIGWVGEGILKGFIAIPFRDETGTILGFIGVKECKLPATFTPNVISLDKKRA